MSEMAEEAQWPPMSQSDCGMSLAPSDFNMADMDDADSSPSTDEEEEQMGISHVASLRCELCLHARRTFYCAECVRGGKYVHSEVARCRGDDGQSRVEFGDGSELDRFSSGEG